MYEDFASVHSSAHALIAAGAALCLSVAFARPGLAFDRYERIIVPPVPSNLQVDPGNRVFLEGHAMVTQNYLCMPCPNAITPATKCPASGFAWAFFGPQASSALKRAPVVR